MNFRKNKSGDVKRASYYVWFLGAKESKGLRGDQFVRPALNFMLDKQDSAVEPSKVTLQVSNKGLKIIQILSVPRKSAKLSADQQMLLFAANQRLRKDLPPSAASLLKTEQVKHHIPHNAITWVFQENDIICTILLLYNPITRCPVHVHAYRCDSIETANNLHVQLQTLVDRPENQKKFREIETRLAAKGLLLSTNGLGFGALEPKDSLNFVTQEDDNRGGFGLDGSGGRAGTREALSGGGIDRRSPSSPDIVNLRYGSTTKTLHSDGRSTRTEGSDEVSEESNSSDLGYAVRSNVNHSMKPERGHHRMLHSKSSSNSVERSSSKPSTRDIVSHHHSATESSHHYVNNKNNMPYRTSSQQQTKQQQPLHYDEPEMPVGLTAALYDSLAAELRAKIGNPKAGPILLPAKDYVESEAKTNLARSESSGKSSSGHGSEEAIETTTDLRRHQRSSTNVNAPTTVQYRHFGDSPEPKSFLDIDRHAELNSYRMQHFDDSDSDSFDGNLVDDDIGEDFEEEVVYSSNRMSKSFFDLPSSKQLSNSQLHSSQSNSGTRQFHVPEPDYTMKRPSQQTPAIAAAIQRSQRDQQTRSQAKLFASNPNLARLSLAEPSNESAKQNVIIGRREQRTLGGGIAPQRPQKQVQKFYFADAEFGRDHHQSSKQQQHHQDEFDRLTRARQLGRSSGNLVHDHYGPTSLGYFPPPKPSPQPAMDRSLSPQTFYHHYNPPAAPLKPAQSQSAQQAPAKPSRKTTPQNSSTSNLVAASNTAAAAAAAAQFSSRNGGNRGYREETSSQQPPQQQQQHRQMALANDAQFRRKLEQPFSRYSYAADRYESSRFANFLPPMRR